MATISGSDNKAGKEASPVVHEYDLRPLIEKAIQEGEQQFPGQKLTAEVEMTEEMTVRIIVKPGEAQEQTE